MQLLPDWRQAPILEQKTALFGFGSGQDLDDASKVVAVADQGGLGLPDRDYYLKDGRADQSMTGSSNASSSSKKCTKLMGESPTTGRSPCQNNHGHRNGIGKASDGNLEEGVLPGKF